MSHIEDEINKSILRAAVVDQIFCPSPRGDCNRKAMDVADAVYVAVGAVGGACCGKCYDAQVERAGPAPASMTIIDGRELFGEEEA